MIEVLKQALEALEPFTTPNWAGTGVDKANAAYSSLRQAIAEAEKQEPVAWKLMPRDATDAMLKAMDECSTEGYDERLYAGHAASVYMAAWDEAPHPPQRHDLQTKGEHPAPCARHCEANAYEIVIRGLKGQLERAEKQEPVVWMYQDKSTHEVRFQKHMRGFVDHGATYETPLYTHPPQRKPLTDEQIECIWDSHVVPVFGKNGINSIVFARAIEQYHGIKGES